MIEFDTQIIPTARAMSFLFSGRVQLSKCAKNFTLPGVKPLFGIYRKAVVYPSPVSQRQFAELVMVKLHVTKGRSADPEGLGCFSLRYAGGCVPSRLCFSKGTAAEILDQKRTGGGPYGCTAQSKGRRSSRCSPGSDAARPTPYRVLVRPGRFMHLCKIASRISEPTAATNASLCAGVRKRTTLV